MKNKIVISQLLFAMLIPCFNITAFATQTDVSKEEVEYSEFNISRDDLEDGKKETCKVYVSMPYEFSEEIPKEPPSETSDNRPNENVQTGDTSNIFLYSLLFFTSIIGIITLKVKQFINRQNHS